MRSRRNRRGISLLCGMLGCACMGAGDWLMIYGDAAYRGSLSWLTVGAAEIAPWGNALAMALAFPGIIFYGIALFAIAAYLKKERQRKVYRYLTAFSLTPWLCLHLDAGARQQCISKGEGFIQSADTLCAFEAVDHADAGQRVPSGLHQRPDEREHADLVWQYAAMERNP